MMSFLIVNHLTLQRYTVSGEDNVSVEMQIRDLFPDISELAPKGNLPKLLWAIDNIHGLQVIPLSGYVHKRREGILPDPPKDDPKHDDPWPREGDDPERMNDYLLEK
jgi:hypothetical protein